MMEDSKYSTTTPRSQSGVGLSNTGAHVQLIQPPEPLNGDPPVEMNEYRTNGNSIKDTNADAKSPNGYVPLASPDKKTSFY